MKILFIISAFLFSMSAYAQSTYPDSLLSILKKAENDSVRYIINFELGEYYANRDRRKSIQFDSAALEIARKNNKLLDVARNLNLIGFLLNRDNKYGEAFKCYRDGFVLAEDPANETLSWLRPKNANPYQYRMEVLAGLHHNLGHVLRSTGNEMEAIYHFKECLKYLEMALPTSYNSANMNIGATFLDLNQLDSAFHYTKKALDENVLIYKGFMLKYMGDIFYRQAQYDSAFHYYHQSLLLAAELKDISQEIISQYGLAQWHLAKMDKDSSLFYSTKFLNGIKKLQGNPLKDINISNAYQLMYQSYQLRSEKDSTMKYLELSFTTRDSISQARIAALTQYLNITFAEQLRLEELEKEKLLTQNRIRVYSLFTGLVFILIVAIIFYRNANQKQKANLILENTLSELKSTQAQLVQQEKLASLGQLTAGIAHEIKNPLNFVNNFSEVSMEMIEEIKEERAKSQETRDETLVDEIMEDIQSNLGKIHEHGSRANGIVTSMLQHSRGGSGKKEPTDLNALIKEYVNLSFHGMRAGKNPIDVDIELDLDPELGDVPLIKEDFTRVVINLCNNAFDACAERSRSAMREKTKMYNVPSTMYQEGVHSEEKYLPKLKVTTMLENGRVRIAFEDNGPGIPDEIKDKILQPFFTTKKGTEGTGLGLSITHDIIKAHGGELRIESTIGKGSEFVIQLPNSQTFK
jgi:two-component system, NtrC family, sensor kinase